MTIPGPVTKFLLALALFAMVPAAVSAAILPLEGSERSDIFSHPDGSRSFRLSELQSVSVDGSDYYAFLLDARDAAPGHAKDLSLDALRLYSAERSDLRSLEAVAVGGALGWEMPGNAVKWPWGAGDADFRRGTDRRVILIARSAFEGVDPDRYLYLYSRFSSISDGMGDRGGHVDKGRGLSDWHALEAGPLVAEPPTPTSPPPVAEPSTLLMIGTGLLAAVSAGKRRRR